MKRLAVTLVCAAALSPAASPENLRIAVVQMSLGPTLEANRDRIVAWIPKASAQRARVVVFPEGALSGRGEATEGNVPEAVRAIRAAAAASRVYVLFGGWTWNDHLRKTANWMRVVDPDGRELLHYDKLWDVHDAATPGLFLIDGVPASAIICADRWLRGIEELPIQQGAQISFELSNNFASEWVPDLEWYWYVPRALRNGAYVVFANTANRTPGHSEAGVNQGPRHGHSAVIAPDGTVASAVPDDLEKLLIVDLDLSKATRAEAIRRRTHPALSRFWQTGLELMNGPGSSAASPLSQLDAPAIDLHVAAGQIPDGDFAAMGEMILEAGRQRVDLIAFAAFAEDAAAADSLVHRIRAASRQASVATAFALGDTAYIIGPKGDLLTSHRQLSAGGASPSTMWFRVKGVPAVVSLGTDALWNELAELAAVAGARLHVNLARERLADSQAILRRRQIGAVLSSYQTITVMANTTHSAIWDDLAAREETRAAVRGTGRETEEVRVFSPFSANLALEAGKAPGLISLRRRIPGRNDYYPGRSARYHPAMDRWYILGAQMLLPEW